MKSKSWTIINYAQLTFCGNSLLYLLIQYYFILVTCYDKKGIGKNIRWIY